MWDQHGGSGMRATGSVVTVPAAVLGGKGETSQTMADKPIRFYLFSTDTPPEEIARVINSLAPEPASSDDEVPIHSGQDLNGDDIDDTDERIVHPGEPNERGLPRT
jgi:hypothetical protein